MKWLAAGLAAVASTQAGAAPSPSPAPTETERTAELSPAQKSAERQSRPLWLYGAVGGGYVNDSGTEFQNALDGPAYDLGLVLSYKTTNWVYDLGAFWMSSSVSGNLPGLVPANVQTRSAMIELSPRYRLSPNWDIGPTVQTLFGTDTNFDINNGSNTPAFFLGLKASYEIPTDALDVRFTLSAAPDLSVSGRTVWMFLGGIQFGLPLSSGEKPAPAPKPTPTPTPVATLAVPQKELRLTLPPKLIYFKTASWQLTDRAKQMLRKIGELLAKNDLAWGSLEISGHTDERGTYAYNLKLSQRRSDSVIEQIGRGGARPSKMKMEAFAFTRPAVQGKTEAAFAQNRRVELVFKNVSNPGLIEREITRIVREQPAGGREKIPNQ